MPATSRATVVLPVPGLPRKTRCRVMVGLRRPAVGAQLLDPQQLRLPVHLALDRREPGQRVELGEQLLQRLRRCRRLLRGVGLRRDAAPCLAAPPARPSLRPAPGSGAPRAARVPGPRHGRRRRLQLGRGGDRGVADHVIVGSPRPHAAEATSTRARA